MENEKTKRKNIVTIAIGVFIMLVLVVGSTYAFFQITGTTEDNTSTNFKGELENLTAYGTPHLSGALSDLHITLSASDMALSKAPKTYWATNVKENNYEEDRIDYTMSTASVSGGTVENGTLECTSDLTITATLVETEEGTEVLENPFVKEDGYVYLSATSETSGNKGKINPDTIDLKTIVDAKEYKTKISYTIVGNTSVDIKAAINIINRNANQNALAGKKLTFDIKNSNLKCEVSEKKAFMTTLFDNEKLQSGNINEAFKLGADKHTAVEKIEFVKRLPSTEEIDRMISEGLAFDLTDTSMSPEKSVIGWLELSGNRGQVYDFSSGDPQLKEGELYNLYIGSKETIYAKDLSYMSYMMMNFKEIKFDNLNTSETIFAEFMFYYYQGETLDLSNLDMSNIIVDENIYGESSTIKTLKLNNTKIFNHFIIPRSVINLEMNNIDTSQVTDMSHMFSGYKGTSLDLSNFDTSNVTDMSYMFSYASTDLPFKDWPNFVTSNVEDMSNMFYGYQGKTLDLSTFDTSNVTNMSYMFGDEFGEGVEATIIFPQGFGSSAIDMSYMFYGYQGETLDLSTFDTSKVTNMSKMLYDSITNITFPQRFGSSAIDMSWMFGGYQGETLDLSNFDTSKVTNMGGMFSGCSKLTTLDLSTFDTSKVTDMRSMFWNCDKLTTLNLSNFTFDKVTNVNDTFYNVPSDCTVTINSSQETMFKRKFPLNGISDRKFKLPNEE